MPDSEETSTPVVPNNGPETSVSSSSSGSKLEVLIDGKYYDVTQFVKKHPGGRVINFYLNGTEDASSAFHAFHSRSEKAPKFLKTLSNRPQDVSSILKTSNKNQEMMNDFEKLREELEKEGFFQPAPAHIAYRVAEILLMHLLGFVLLFNGWIASAIFFLGIVQGRCGWFMHEGGHYSLTGKIQIDRALQVIGYGVGCGMSASWWRSQHNRHHAMPQRLKHDVDLDTLPLVAFHFEIGKRGAKFATWLRLQAYLFAPLTCLLVGLGWQFFLHPRHSWRTKQYPELVCFAFRYALVAVLGYLLGASVSMTIFCYVLYVWVGAAYIFTNFALSHTHTPVLQPTDQANWMTYAANHTVNIQPSFVVDWWMGYLNYQIEHHLFPSMPQFRNRAASIRVKKLFAKHGLEYKEMSYLEALGATFSNLDHVGREVSSIAKERRATKKVE